MVPIPHTQRQCTKGYCTSMSHKWSEASTNRMYEPTTILHYSVAHLTSNGRRLFSQPSHTPPNVRHAPILAKPPSRHVQTHNTLITACKKRVRLVQAVEIPLYVSVPQSYLCPAMANALIDCCHLAWVPPPPVENTIMLLKNTMIIVSNTPNLSRGQAGNSAR